MSDLVCSEDAERLHHLVGRVGVGRLSRHELQERVERDVAHVIGVNVRHDSLEISVALSHDIQTCVNHLCVTSQFTTSLDGHFF